ncbi:MAG: hypothetical protein GIX02_06595 [Candidatus Eremiobacteraeota bacterium]|nr:hypothetical protein [Candidatus Eremiobacteraeota bacterium]
MARFLLGINYWPRTSAMSMWERFDERELDADFALVASLGFECVRFFMLWQHFQPQPDRTSATALAQLERVMEALARRGLAAMPTFFTGHMSGVNWLPSWTLDAQRGCGRFRTLTENGFSDLGIGDFYTGTLLQAQRDHVRTVGARLRGHPSLYAWDLGNEFSNLRAPASVQESDRWSSVLTADLIETSGTGATAGTHGEDLSQDRNIRPSSMCAPLCFPTMHGYSVYSDFARTKDDPQVVPFLCELTRSFSGRPVLFSEFGSPTCPPTKVEAASYACLTETEMCPYALHVLDGLHAGGALGAFWWCFADYDLALKDRPPFDCAPHELTFGIVRSDGSLKPVAATLSGFAGERRQVKRPAAGALLAVESAYYADLPRSLTEAYQRYTTARERTSPW